MLPVTKARASACRPIDRDPPPPSVDRFELLITAIEGLGVNCAGHLLTLRGVVIARWRVVGCVGYCDSDALPMHTYIHPSHAL